MNHSMRSVRTRLVTTCLLTSLLLGAFPGLAQQPAPPPQVTLPPAPSTPVNFFSVQQDREIGAESIKVADKDLPIIRSLVVNTFVKTIAARLAPYSPTQSITYRVQIVNSKSVNTLTYPGGPIYLDRG